MSVWCFSAGALIRTAYGCWGGNLTDGSTYSTSERWLGNTADDGFRTEVWSEFSAVGTYEFRMTITAPYDDDATDSTTGTEYSSAKTYTLHVGPMVEPEVKDGGSDSPAASDRRVLTIIAANGGPDHSPDAEITGLPGDRSSWRRP